MSRPITWRNVGATVSNSGTGSLMQGAQESLDSGFGALEKVLKQRQDLQQQNWDQGRENNTNAVMNRLMSVQSPEELAALRERGEFTNMLNGYGAQVDQDRLRTAIDERGGVLRDRVGERQQYQDRQHNRGLRDEVQRELAAAYQGDQGAFARLQELGYRDNGELLETGFGAYQDARNLQHDEDANSRGWVNTRLSQNQDARAGEVHDTRMTDWREGQDAEARQRDIFAAVNQASTDSDGTTQDRQALIADLKQRFPNENPKTWDRVRSHWDSLTEGRYGLSQFDATNLSQQEQRLASGYNMETNPLYQAQNANPFDAAMDVVNRHSQEGGYFTREGNQDVAEDARYKIMELINSGITLDSGRRVPVPPEAIDMALHQSRDDWFEFDTKFPDAIKEILESDSFRQNVEDYGEFTDLVNEHRLKETQRLSGRPGR